MRVSDIVPTQIASIHVDRQEDGVLIPHVLDDWRLFLRFHSHKRVTRVGRLVCGKRFRILLRQRQDAITDLGKFGSSTAAFQTTHFERIGL